MIRTIFMLTFWGLSTLIVGPFLLLYTLRQRQCRLYVPGGHKVGHHRRAPGGRQNRSFADLNICNPVAATSSCRTMYRTSIPLS